MNPLTRLRSIKEMIANASENIYKLANYFISWLKMQAKSKDYMKSF